MIPGNISLRDVAGADRPFLLELYAATRAGEMAMVPWTPSQKHAFVEMQFAAQLRGYAETYPEATHHIILAAGQPTGRIYLHRTDSHIRILDITISPACRNSGIGSALLRDVLSEADRTRKTVSIHVEDFNPSLRLFERLAFCVAVRDGFLLLLERPPAPLAAG